MCLGIPGRIIEVIDAGQALAMVEVGGVRRAVNISFIMADDRPAESCVGDWVLLHVGFAMSRLDEDEAARTLAILQEVEELQSEMAALSLPEQP